MVCAIVSNICMCFGICRPKFARLGMIVFLCARARIGAFNPNLFWALKRALAYPNLYAFTLIVVE